MSEELYADRVASYYAGDISLNDTAHDMRHCVNVYNKMVNINNELKLGIDGKLLALAAYLHDLKVHVDRKNHHILAVKYILLNVDIDPFLKELTEDELYILMGAIISHRASVINNHTSKLSELLYTADKDEPDITTIILRSLEYSNNDAGKVLYHMRDKFARDGYVKYNELYVEYYGIERIEKLYQDIDKLTINDIQHINKNA